MLIQLRVTGFALLDQVEINFGPGLNVLTGETGAGKSILIDALGMILGNRASVDIIRTGSDRAVIEALFQLDNTSKISQRLGDIGIDMELDGSVLLVREITNAGRNSCRINGRVVTVSMLRMIGKQLIDLHGQHEHQSLLDIENHLELLDSFGGQELLELRSEVEELYEQIIRLNKQLFNLRLSDRDQAKLIDLLEYQITEITEADLRAGEEDELLKEKKLLLNAEKLSQLANTAHNIVRGKENHFGSSMIDSAFEVSRVLRELSIIDENKNEAFIMLESIAYQLEDIAMDLRVYIDNVEYDADRLNQVEARLHIINQLKRKYGDSIEDILTYQTETLEKLRQYQHIGDELNGIEEKISNLLKQYSKKSKQLSIMRIKTSKGLGQTVLHHLAHLGMNSAQFICDINTYENIDCNLGADWHKQISKRGIDKVQFLFSSNQGESPMPLAKIASGGELSRVMLALTVSLSGLEPVPTMIFDEVDVGVGGRTAYTIGDKLIEVSRNHQVICVTHLPQIACTADHHYYIFKKIDKKRTYTHVKSLNEQERIEELSRMLGATETTVQVSLEHAKELRIAAQQKKK